MVVHLHRVTDNEQHCFNCFNPLGSQRCAANTPIGPRWFCKQEPRSNPSDSCYQSWRRRQARAGKP
jgi:hypothetical protein